MTACSTASSTAAAVPVVQLHVAVVAEPHQLVWPLQQLLAVLQEADTPSPRVAGARGLHQSTPVPAVIQKGKRSLKKIENDKKTGQKSNKSLCLTMHLQLEPHLKCVVIARYF